MKTVDHCSLVLIHCQQESPIWGVVKKETLFSVNSSVMIQYGCGTAQECYSSIMHRHAVRWPSGQGPLARERCLLCSWQDLCGVSAPVREMPSSVFRGKDNLAPPASGELTLYRVKSLLLVPGRCVVMQMMTPNPHHLICRQRLMGTSKRGRAPERW